MSYKLKEIFYQEGESEFRLPPTWVVQFWDIKTNKLLVEYFSTFKECNDFVDNGFCYEFSRLEQ